ncbi:MAG: ATP-binding protein [Myxococcota bacterium]|nr:ATP-binding protein [Myxococcota bacterium]
MADPAELSLLTMLFDNLPLGLIVLDPAGKVVVYNRAEERLAGRSRDVVIGAKFFEDVAPCMNVQELGGAFVAQIGRGALDVSVEMSFPFPLNERPRDVRVRMCSLEVANTPYGFLMIEDTSLPRAVERMREQLQSLLVHDLKNPLAVVSTNLQLLTELASVRDTPDAVEAITDALVATQRLNRMTMNLLDISQLETSSMPVRRTRTDVARLLDRVRNDNATIARSHRARIEILPGATFDVELDEDLVVRALDNLVENALRHARTVTLSAELGDRDVALVVRDDGPGVPLELRERLFDKYVQVSPSNAARGMNRGLGLTFVKLVVTQHGGDVSLVCPPDGGTVFTLRFPLLTAATGVGGRGPQL